MKHAFILGTRPEIIKLSPVVRSYIRRKLPFSIIHTNQHYSPQMDAVFFKQLELPAPEFNLNAGSGSHGAQLGKMLESLEPVLQELAPEAAIVQGDTNSVLAGALIASRLGIPVAHVEAGLLVTLHRPENVDSKEILTPILEAINELSTRHGLPAVFPVHPRTVRRLKEFGIELPRTFLALEAADYLSFVQLEKEARLIITDSGGVQEEACILGVPCVTVRLSTERPETVEVGANLVTGVAREAIVAGAEKMLARRANWVNPFGDGRAGERIVEIILESRTD